MSVKFAVGSTKWAQRWRERLLAEGDGGLSALVTECPNAERQRLRQLIRKANKIAPGTPAREQAERELTAALRGTLGGP
jgi:ribosome-associated protein